MMYRFSNECDRVMKAATKYAACSRDGLLGTEYIVAAMLTVDCFAGQFLKDQGLTADLVPSLIQINTSVQTERVTLTERTRKVLRDAMAIAMRTPEKAVTSDMLLLAILHMSDSYAVGKLRDAGCDTEAVLGALNDRLIADAPEEAEDDISDLASKLSGMFGGMSGGMSDDQEERHSSKPGAKGFKGKQELEKIGCDLTEKAREGKLDPVIGRSKEIDRIIEILSRRTKNNPVLIGEPGVGKSAIVEGLAQAIVNGEVPEMLRGKTVFSLDMASLVSGTKYRGEFEERMKNALNIIKENGNIILFIDEIHMIVGAGSSTDNAMDAANILKPMLARGEMQTIGATTVDEYTKFIEKDAALERRFQPIMVEPPTVDETIVILKGLREKYEKFHNVTITDSAIKAAAVMSDRYISDRFLPDKAIDLIDEAASKKRVSNFVLPQPIKEKEDEQHKLEIELKNYLNKQNYAKCAEVDKRIKEIKAEIEDAKREWNSSQNKTELSIDENDIAEVVSLATSIPVAKITESEGHRLMTLEDELRKRVIGQDEAVSAVARAVRRARAGIQDAKRPIGSFIFLGPTGVGKTELSKALAEAMFGDENLMIRVDMSEYMEKESVSKFIGSAPGYVGYDEGGQLTEKVRHKPYSVILFDEIEKAHPDMFNILLQVLDEGHLKDSHGREVNFKNTVIIMTSNIGATEIKNSHLGFGSTEQEYDNMKDKQMDALKRTLKPEFINRIDDIIIFRRLEKEDMKSIADKMLGGVKKRLAEQEITVTFDESVRDFIIDKGFDKEYGARPLKRAVQRYIEDVFAEKILTGEIKQGDVLTATSDGKTVTCSK